VKGNSRCTICDRDLGDTPLSREAQKIVDGFEALWPKVTAGLTGPAKPLSRAFAQQIVDLKDFLAVTPCGGSSDTPGGEEGGD
jgi:hypothetical protein